MPTSTLACQAFPRSVTAASVFASSLEVGELYGRSAAGFLGLLRATGLYQLRDPRPVRCWPVRCGPHLRHGHAHGCLYALSYAFHGRCRNRRDELQGGFTECCDHWTRVAGVRALPAPCWPSCQPSPEPPPLMPTV